MHQSSQGIRAPGFSLCKANLTNSQWGKSDLANVDLSGATTDGASFHACYINGANDSSNRVYKKMIKNGQMTHSMVNADLTFVDNSLAKSTGFGFAAGLISCALGFGAYQQVGSTPLREPTITAEPPRICIPTPSAPSMPAPSTSAQRDLSSRKIQNSK